MLEVLFGSRNAEKVLQYLLVKEEGYIREIAQFYDISPSVIKSQIDKFEKGSVIVGTNIANIRMYSLNKRYAFYDELVALLKKARYSYSEEDRMKLISKNRKRPRSNNKPLNLR